MYKSYKYKVEYKVWGAMGAPKEVKMDTYEDLEGFLGSIVMIVQDAYVYQKVKGQWETIRHIEGHMVYPDNQ